MSKLDRQLDDVTGEGRVVIQIAEGENVDVGALHQLLRNEIDARDHRVPLDLRGVHGAPEALIDVLIESQRYARSKGKLLSISYALPAMRDALYPRRRTPSASQPKISDSVVSAPDAGTVAKTLLDTQLSDETTYDISKAKKIKRDRKPRTKKNRRLRDYLILALMISVLVVLVGLVEWVIVFNRPSIIAPEKTFEHDAVNPLP